MNIGSAIKSGLVSLASMAASIVSMAGGVVIRSVVTAFNAAASAWRKLKEFENSQETSSVSSESACLNVWYGTHIHAKLSDNSMLGNEKQLNRYSTVMYDDGLVKYLFTSNRTGIDDVLTFDVRAYSRALYKISDSELYELTNTLLAHIYDIGYKANSGVLLVYAKKRYHDVEASEVYGLLNSYLLKYQVSQAEFDNLDENYKINSYYLGNVLAMLTRLYPTITSDEDQLFYYDHYGTVRQGYLLPLFTTVTSYSDFYVDVVEALNNNTINPWHALFTLLSLPHCAIEVGKASMLTGVGWLCLNRIFNAISDAIYYEAHGNN